MTIQIIKTPAGDMVVLPIAEYEALLAVARPYDEDADDVAIFDERMAAIEADAVLPVEVSALILKGATRLKAIRKWRGLTQAELAMRAKVVQGYVSDIEAGRKSGSAETIAAIATALDVPVSWIE